MAPTRLPKWRAWCSSTRSIFTSTHDGSAWRLRAFARYSRRLQFVVTTHSPQVLSSVDNRQARRLFDGKLQAGNVFVEGRDTNAILREYMHTDDRDDGGVVERSVAFTTRSIKATPSRRIGSTGNCGGDGETATRPLSEPRASWRSRCGDLAKARPPANVSPDGQTPRSFAEAEQEYLAALPDRDNKVSFARSEFGRLEKGRLRQVMYGEQGSLCVYCERRIAEGDATPRIDHWRPLSTDPRFRYPLEEPLLVLSQT